MRRLLALSSCVWLWFVVGTAVLPVHAAQPGDGIPDSASVVVRFKSPKASLDKLADYVDAVQPGTGETVRASLPGLGQVIGNPGLEGVDHDQEIWAVMFAAPNDPPMVVMVVTASDVDDLKDALPANFEIHTVGKLVAYSENAEALEEVRKGLEGEAKPLWAKIDPSSKKLFDGADVAALVNIRQLAEDFSDELDQAEPQLNDFIDRLVETLPEAQRPQLEPAFGMYRQLGRLLVRGVRDSNSLVLGVTITNSAIQYEDRLQVTAGTPTAEFLNSQSPGEMSLIGKLPPGKPLYFGLKANLSGMIEWSMNITKAMLRDMPKDRAEQFDAAAKELGKLKYEELAMYLDVGDKSPAIRGGGVTAVTPASKLREISHKLLKSMGEIRTAGFTQTTELELDAEKIGGFSVDRVTVKQEYDEAVDPTGVQKKVQALLLGEAGMEQLVLYQGRENRVLQTLGGKEEMQGLLTALGSADSEDAALAAARKQHPQKANLLVLLDISRLLSSGFKLAAGEGAIPLDVHALEDVKLEPSFISYSLVCEPTATRTQLRVPVAQIQNIARLATLFRPQ